MFSFTRASHFGYLFLTHSRLTYRNVHGSVRGCGWLSDAIVRFGMHRSTEASPGGGVIRKAMIFASS